MSDKIGFIGYGKMADAIASGIHHAFSDSVRLMAVEINLDHCQWIEKDRPFISLMSLQELIAESDIVFLAIKPQQLRDISEQLDASFGDHQCIVSMLAGTSISTCQQLLNHDQVIRIMPNTPATLRRGLTGVFCPDLISKGIKAQCERFISAIGEVVYVKNEDDLNVITALSGSGPAFFYRMVKVFIEFAESKGLDYETAVQSVVATMIGSGHMIQEHGDPLALIQQVASPNGTTERGLSIMDDQAYDDILTNVLTGTYDRAVELSKED